MYTIKHGAHYRRFYTDYHAAQYMRALELNGTKFEVIRS